MSETPNKDISRRDFLKKLWLWLAGIAIAWWTTQLISKALSQKETEKKWLLFKNTSHDYRDQDLPWFDTKFSTEKIKTDHNNHIIKDCWLDFYITQPDDTTRTNILNKLESDYPYIAQDKRYQKQIYGINIKAEELTEKIPYKWKNIPRNQTGVFFIPIPIQIKHRSLSYEQMANYSLQWIDRLMSYVDKHPTIDYNDKTINLQHHLKTRLKTISPQRLATFINAFARSESSAIQDISTKGNADIRSTFDPIWELELSRYEKWYNAFSFTHMHLFMAQWHESLAARKHLWLTEWQSTHPINSAQLFLIYCILKTQWWKPLYTYINDENIFFKDIAIARNGSWQAKNNYENKLRNNFKFCRSDMKDSKWKKIWLWRKHTQSSREDIWIEIE